MNATRRVFPSTSVAYQTATVYGRQYSGVPGQFFDILNSDSQVLNGWTRGPLVGPSSSRPQSVDGFQLAAGELFIDETLGAVIIFDGLTWRDVMTAEAV